ncbi:hypothetical protein ACROYT_G022583 [Oculina patagonica]
MKLFPQKLLKLKKSKIFFFKDFTHGTTITGSWVDKDSVEDYMVKMEINSIKLNMKLVFEFTENKDSANVNSTPSGNRTPKYGKIQKAKKYGRNDGTCPVYKPFIPRLPDVIYPSWRYDMTTKISWLADGLWNGMEWMTECIWNCITWIVELMGNGVAWMGNSIWNGVKWMGKSILNCVTWVGKPLWNCVTWMVERMWIGISWTGKLFIPAFNYVTDVVAKFYDDNLDDYVRYIQAYIVSLTWKDVLYTMLTCLAVNFTLYVAYLLIKCTVNFIRRRCEDYARAPRAFYGSIVGTCVANQIARLPIVGQCGYANSR